MPPTPEAEGRLQATPAVTRSNLESNAAHTEQRLPRAEGSGSPRSNTSSTFSPEASTVPAEVRPSSWRVEPLREDATSPKTRGAEPATLADVEETKEEGVVLPEYDAWEAAEEALAAKVRYGAVRL